MTDVAELTQEQWLVLQVIYDEFRRNGDWPTFGVIDRPIRAKLGFDAAKAIASIPDSLILPMRPGSLAPSPTDQVRLSLAAIAACVGSEQDVQRFPALLRWLAQRESEFESDNPNALPEVTSAEVRAHLELGPDDRVALSRLFKMLMLDNWGTSGTNLMSEDQWTVSLGRDIWRFRDVQTIEDCIRVRNEWIEEGRAAAGYRAYADSLAAPAPSIPEQAGNTYVDEKIIGALRAKDGSCAFDLTKLLKLIEELNEIHANERTYACLALTRMILDHVPPILGCKSFDEVASSYGWGKTDKSYMQNLARYRKNGDDAMHRPASPHEDLLSMADVPSRAWINILLRECATKL